MEHLELGVFKLNHKKVELSSIENYFLLNIELQQLCLVPG